LYPCDFEWNFQDFTFFVLALL